MSFRAQVFANCVNDDLQKYIEVQKTNPGCVLLFPAVDNYKRFLIHSSIADTENLCSFSIGQGSHRRTVICDKTNVIRTNEIGGQRSSGGQIVQKRMVHEKSSDIKENIELIKERNKDQKRRPDRQVYVPRGARRTAEPLHIKETKDQQLTPEKMSAGRATGSKGDSTPVKRTESTDEEGDWDSLYADDGVCLDPKIVEELTSAVGNVRIVPAASTAEAEANEEDGEFSHVLEISNFPVEFKTQDLMMLFMAYKEKEIKWVNDTHALIIFGSAKIANEVLSIKYPGVRLKRLRDASDESKGRAKRSGADMRPYKARPETCAALARRLVTGALGVKSKATKDILEKERRILQEARDRKKAQKEQKDVWDDDDDDEAVAS